MPPLVRWRRRASRSRPPRSMPSWGFPSRPRSPCLIEQSGPGNELRDQVDAIHDDFVSRSIAFYRDDPSVYEVPGATRVFEVLKKSGIRVALDTGFNRSIAQVILDRLGWSGSPSDRCHHLQRRGQPRASSSGYDSIALWLDLGSAIARRVAKVGDTPADLQEGENAGCGLVVGVTGGTHSRRELEPYPHTNLIETIADFPGLLGLAVA